MSMWLPQLNTRTEDSEQHRSVALIRLIWVDYAGILRTKIFPRKYLSENPRVAQCGMVLTVWGGYPADGTQGPTGEVGFLSPQAIGNPEFISNVRQIRIPWHPSHSFMFADFHDSYGKPWVHCPRGILRRAVELLEKQNLKAQAGFEMEFVLRKRTDENGSFTSYTDMGTMIYASAQAADMVADVLDDMITTLYEMDIDVRMVHAENGAGQFEIVLQHRPVQRAVEDIVIAREAVRSIARRHGLHATFAPTWDNTAGNGGHVHISLDEHFGTERVKTINGVEDSSDINVAVDEIGRKFIAGIVEGLPWVMFALNASPASYRRVKPGAWTGAYQTWGISNKEAPVRLAEDHSNVEIKVGDGISNPFIGLAAVITAGAAGIQKKFDLPPPCQVDPGSVASERGYKRLPETVDVAMKHFRNACQDELIQTVFTDEVMQDFIAVRKEELRYAKENGTEALQSLVLKMF